MSIEPPGAAKYSTKWPNQSTIEASNPTSTQCPSTLTLSKKEGPPIGERPVCDEFHRLMDFICHFGSVKKRHDSVQGIATIPFKSLSREFMRASASLDSRSPAADVGFILRCRVIVAAAWGHCTVGP
jgi:hypothetical protein